eukprot:4790933-Pyramimonas_sp.AAC.1
MEFAAQGDAPAGSATRSRRGGFEIRSRSRAQRGRSSPPQRGKVELRKPELEVNSVDLDSFKTASGEVVGDEGPFEFL